MDEPLISANRLRDIIDDLDLVIADCRWYLDDPDAGHINYLEGHIPGARYVHLNDDLSGRHGPGRHPLPSPERFGETCSSLGIGDRSLVVAYDDRGGAVAARMWWMLRNQNHQHVSVLDGGLDAWNAAGGPLSDEVPAPSEAVFPTHPWTGVVDRFDVKDRPDTTKLLDARSVERFRGDEEPVDPKAGHIPGAVSVPLTDNLMDDMTFMAPQRLRERFAVLGLTDQGRVISYCGSGVTACHNILAMTVAGFSPADLYVGSWSDWSVNGFGVETGDSPG